MEQNERMTHSLQGLLKLSLKLSDQEVKEYDKLEMSTERGEWLRKAMDAALENDDAKRLVFLIEMFCKFSQQENFSEKDISDICDNFEEINFLVEGFDMNTVFNNLGGFEACINFLKCSHHSLQWRSADLLANCVQNNIKCQNTVLAKDGLQCLFGTLQSSGNDTVQVKCVYAISSLIGGNPNGEKLFVNLNGVYKILQFLSSNNDKLRLKSAFLLQKIMFTEAGKGFDHKMLIEPMVHVLKQEHSDVLVSASQVLVTILENQLGPSTTLFSTHSAEIGEILRKRIHKLKSSDSHMYEDAIISYSNLLKFC